MLWFCVQTVFVPRHFQYHLKKNCYFAFVPRRVRGTLFLRNFNKYSCWDDFCTRQGLSYYEEVIGWLLYLFFVAHVAMIYSKIWRFTYQII